MWTQCRPVAGARDPSQGGVMSQKPANPKMNLDDELAGLDAHLKDILTAAHPQLLAAHGVGPDTAGALLVAAGDNPERLRTEQSFAALCGAHHRCRPPPATPAGTGSTGAETARPTAPSGASSWSG